jgi:hypothetical protein
VKVIKVTETEIKLYLNENNNKGIAEKMKDAVRFVKFD